MKKTKQKTRRISKRFMLIVATLVVLIFSIFKLGNTFASTDSFTVTNVEVSSKTNTTEVNSVSFDGTNISSDVTFHSVNDSITYKITIKNNEEKAYTIKALVDNNESENITFVYDNYSGTKLNPNEEVSILVTEKYSKEVTDMSKRIQANAVNLTLTFEDEEGNQKDDEVVINPESNKPSTDNAGTEETSKVDDTKTSEAVPVENKTKNPKTGDNVGVYIATAVGSTILLIVLSRKRIVTTEKNSKASHAKHGKKMLGLVLAIVVTIPAFNNISNAATAVTLDAKITGTVKFMDKIVVSYTVNGKTKEVVIGYNDTLEKIEEPVKEGFIFTGWVLEDGTPFNESTKISSDLVLVPQFEELVKSSEITINILNEEEVEAQKEVTISAVNTNITDDKVQLQYSLDNGETWTNYEGKITVIKTVTLKARTIIKENEEVIGTAEKEVTVDEDLAKLRAYFVGNNIMQLFVSEAGKVTFINNEILPDASSITEPIPYSIISQDDTDMELVCLINYNEKTYSLNLSVTVTEQGEEYECISVEPGPRTDAQKIKTYFEILELNRMLYDCYDEENGLFVKDKFGLLETDVKVLLGNPDSQNILVLYKGHIYEYKAGVGVEDTADINNMTDLERLQAYFDYNLDRIAPTENMGYLKDEVGILESDFFFVWSNVFNYFQYNDSYYKIVKGDNGTTVSLVDSDIEKLKASYVNKNYSDVVDINKYGEEIKHFKFLNCGLIEDAENIEVLYYNYIKYNGKIYRLSADIDIDAEAVDIDEETAREYQVYADERAFLLGNVWTDRITDIQEIDTTNDLQTLKDYFIGHVKQSWNKVRTEIPGIVYLAALNEDTHIIVYHGNKYILNGEVIAHGTVNISEVSQMPIHQTIKDSQIQSLSLDPEIDHYGHYELGANILFDYRMFDFKEDVTYQVYEEEGRWNSETGDYETFYPTTEYNSSRLQMDHNYKLVLTGKESGYTKEIIVEYRGVQE